MLIERTMTNIEEPCNKKIKANETETECNKTKTLEEHNVPSEAVKSVNLADTSSAPLSKNQQKKLKKLEQWEHKKKLKRIKEREKCKQKRQEAIEKGLPARIGPSRKELKRNKAKSENSLRIAIDLDYDDLMINKDVAKCVKQLLRIYTINRRSQMPCNLHFTGIKTDGRIHEALKKNDGYENWDIQWHFNELYLDFFPKSEIVYLSSESDTVLEKLKDDEVYIIGGLVDHNHHKGLSHERAEKQQLKTARLPLSEHVDMKTRSVLSTYHVFEILLRLSEGKSWSDSILETMPVRKGAKLKTQTDLLGSPNQQKSEDIPLTSTDNYVLI